MARYRLQTSNGKWVVTESDSLRDLAEHPNANPAHHIYDTLKDKARTLSAVRQRLGIPQPLEDEPEENLSPEPSPEATEARRGITPHTGVDMDNIEKTKVWALRTIGIGAVGASVGLLLGVINQNDPQRATEWAAIGIFFGAVVLGAIPAVVTVWFLLLHMLGQVADAVSSGSNKSSRKHQVNVEFEGRWKS